MTRSCEILKRGCPLDKRRLLALAAQKQPRFEMTEEPLAGELHVADCSHAMVQPARCAPPLAAVRRAGIGPKRARSSAQPARDKPTATHSPVSRFGTLTAARTRRARLLHQSSTNDTSASLFSLVPSGRCDSTASVARRRRAPEC